MQMRKTTINDQPVQERYSRRFQNGVEIIEREMHYVSDLETDRASSLACPRLVIEDTISSAKESLVSKTREEVAGLNALLRTLAGQPLHSK